MSAIAADAVPAGTYNIDPAHSHIGFEVKHMGIATVRGAFRKFSGSVDASSGLTLRGTVDVASIDTGEENRDAHLQAPDFFDAAQFPQITFESTGARAGADGKLTLSGQITIKGVTKPIQLTGEIAEGGEDPWGKQRIGFEVAASIDRREFGLETNQTLPNGNLLVANEVRLIVSVSAVKAA